VNLYKKDNLLATDIWMISVIGLRAIDLKKVYFQDEKENYYELVKICETKNKHLATRVIPQTLINMMKASKAIYPLSIKRFSKARMYCLSAFSQFYGLRHVCFTSIVSTVLGKIPTLSFHKKHSTTLTYYLDTNIRPIVDKTF
jgi:hypothetical protein